MHKHIRTRRVQGLTNYKKRIALLKGGLPRVVIRKSNRGVLAQVIVYEPSGDRISAQANSNELRAVGWAPRCNIPTAYLTGLMLAKKAKALGGELVADLGLYRPIKSSVVFAAMKGCIDGGLKVRADITFDAKRLSGEAIKAYATSIKSTDTFKKQFSGYAEEKFDVLSITEQFEQAKKKILNQ